MGNIVLLDDLTINKIAAGEVIERPASAVKEVVENSIDAGANNISIEIKNGGISYIRITDNGKGIAPDDMEIAFERHATSKIRKAEDLETVTSMGFRGEALASIAAIARVEMVSKTADSTVGNKIIVEGGKIISKEEVGCPQGTSITIENLFFNTPVRYKFLKKDFTESGYIEDAVTRIALVNPNIAIKFVNTGKTVIQTSENGNLKDVIYGIYGKDIAENLIDIDYTFEDMKVKGVIGKPTIARSNRANQLFFINKRFVKDRTLSTSAEQAYKGSIAQGKFGFLVLNIEMDPHKLDVNVHPAKLEVRFQEENKVFKLIYHAIKEALSQENNIGEIDTMLGDNKKNYLDEFDKHEETHENKGISGFFKNMMNRNEFATNDHNVVEELYNDKIVHGHHTDIREAADEISGQGVDYKFNSISATNAVSEDKSEDYLIKTPAESYDNIIVKADGGIEIKEYNKPINNVQTTQISDETKIFDTSLTQVKPNQSSVSDETLVNFNWTDAKIEALKEQINALTNSNRNESTNVEETKNPKIIEVEQPKKDPLDVYLGQKKSTKIINTVEPKKEEAADSISDTHAFDLNQIAETDIDLKKVIQELGKPSTEETASQKEEVKEQVKPIEKAEAPKIETPKVEEPKTEEPKANFEEMYAKMFGTPVVKTKEEPEPEKDMGGIKVADADLKTVSNISLFNNKSVFSGPAYKFIGVVFNSNIIIEYENEMYIIDQHVANERIMYEKVKNNYYKDGDKDSQLMLLPDVIDLNHKQMGIAKDNINLFKKAGFDVEIFGENTVKLTGVPSLCIDLDTRQLFLDTLDEINTVARTATKEIEEKFIETIASKTAEKAKIAVTEPEVNGLMNSLLSLKDPFVCPDGKQAAIKMSRADIEKKFSRR